MTNEDKEAKELRDEVLALIAEVRRLRRIEQAARAWASDYFREGNLKQQADGPVGQREVEDRIWRLSCALRAALDGKEAKMNDAIMPTAGESCDHCGGTFGKNEPVAFTGNGGWYHECCRGDAAAAAYEKAKAEIARLREENERLGAVVDAAVAWYTVDTRAGDDYWPLMNAVQAYLDGKELG